MQLQLKLDNLKEAMKKIACNIKNDSKSFFVTSKQNVQNKVGPLEDCAGIE